MPKVKVALVNTLEAPGIIRKPGIQSYANIVIGKTLQERNFDVEFFPDIRYIMDNKRTAKDVARAIKGSDIPVVGFSVFSDSYAGYVESRQAIEGVVPDAVFVGGGPHFAREDDDFRDSIDIELQEGRLDAATYGHCKAFINFCEGLRDGSIGWDDKYIKGRLPSGFYAASKNGVRGEGKSGLPDTKMPFVLSNSRNRFAIMFMVDSGCPNGCDYCISPGGTADLDERYVKFLPKFQKSKYYKNSLLSIVDNNPFMRTAALDFLRQLREREIMFEAGVFADDSLFAYDGWESVLETCEELKITHLFVGRETPSERVAGTIGRKLYGKPRDQKLLDASFEGLINFKKATKKGKSAKSMVVGYLSTPFEDKDSASRMGYEMEMLEDNDPLGIITICCNHLRPYFGTRIRKKYRDIIIDPDNPFLLNTETIQWKPGYNPGAYNFMCYILGHQFDPSHETKNSVKNVLMWPIAREAAETSFDGTLHYDAPFTLSEHPKVLEACEAARALRQPYL